MQKELNEIKPNKEMATQAQNNKKQQGGHRPRPRNSAQWRSTQICAGKSYKQTTKLHAIPTQKKTRQPYINDEKGVREKVTIAPSPLSRANEK